MSDSEQHLAAAARKYVRRALHEASGHQPERERVDQAVQRIVREFKPFIAEEEARQENVG